MSQTALSFLQTVIKREKSKNSRTSRLSDAPINVISTD